MISGLWIGLISIKDQKLTFGTAGSYNYALVGPQSQGVPDYIEGIQIQIKLIQNLSQNNGVHLNLGITSIIK